LLVKGSDVTELFTNRYLI